MNSSASESLQVLVLAAVGGVARGVTLPLLLSRLALPHDESVEEEVALARAEAARAALDILGANAHTDRNADAERTRVAALRQEERIGDDAFRRVEEELDWAEAEMDGAGR